MDSNQNKLLGQILSQLQGLEKRISLIEEKMGIRAAAIPVYLPEEADRPAEVAPGQHELEFRIGEFWFARIGIIVLAIGFAFLLTLKYENLPAFLPPLIGYLLVGGLLFFSYYSRKTFGNLSRYMMGAGLVLFFFTTLRLHYFGESRLVTSPAVETALLLGVVGFNLAVAFRRESIYLTVLSLAMVYLTALLNGNPLLLFLLLTFAAAGFAYSSIRFNAPLLAIPAILLTYTSHFLWFINNPVMGNTLRFVEAPFYNIWFVLLYAAIIALGQLYLVKQKGERNTIVVTTLLNCLFGYALFFLLTFSVFAQGFSISHLVASALFLGLSILFWTRVHGRYTTFFYAMLGYSALSAAIIAEFPHPDRFIFLSWQSVLVVVTALWFRSRIIVAANLVIFLLIFLAYLFFAGEVRMVSLSFGVISLLSARIMHWQSERLEIKTEFLRNTYLAAGFISFPYALYHSAPRSYVILSWIALTIFYYLISMVLKNKKYRYLALGTVVLTVCYIFIIGIAQLPPLFRVLSFILLGVFLLIVSLVYTRIRSRAGRPEGAGEGRPNPDDSA